MKIPALYRGSARFSATISYLGYILTDVVTLRRRVSQLRSSILSALQIRVRMLQNP